MLLLGYPTLRDREAGLLLDKWIESPLEFAVGEDGFMCKKFLSNKCCIDVLNMVFSGYTYELQSDKDEGDGACGRGGMGDDNDERNLTGIDNDYIEPRSWLRTGHMHGPVQLPFNIGGIYVRRNEAQDVAEGSQEQETSTGSSKASSPSTGGPAQ